MDGCNDDEEDSAGTDPNDPDSDNDGATDGEEKTAGTDANNPDSDNDGIDDGYEIENSLDPNDDGTTDINNGPDGDPDMDNLTNLDEFLGDDGFFIRGQTRGG